MSAWIAIGICFGVVLIAAMALQAYEKYLDHKEEMARIYGDREK